MLESGETIDLYLLHLWEESLVRRLRIVGSSLQLARSNCSCLSEYYRIWERSICAHKQVPSNCRDEIVTSRSEVSGSIDDLINFRPNLHCIARALLQINWVETLYDRVRLMETVKRKLHEEEKIVTGTTLDLFLSGLNLVKYNTRL